MLILPFIVLLFNSFIPATNIAKINATDISLTNDIQNEKRGIPHYADIRVNTAISKHGTTKNHIVISFTRKKLPKYIII